MSIFGMPNKLFSVTAAHLPLLPRVNLLTESTDCTWLQILELLVWVNCLSKRLCSSISRGNVSPDGVI